MLGNVQDTDIKLLRIFRQIVESGGFSPAQAALNMSASSISSHMSQLESRVGGRLCERGHGEFSLTEHGRNVLAASDELFLQLDSFQSAVAKSQNRLVGELRLGMIDNGITHPDERILEAINKFHENAPDATINLATYDYYGLEPNVVDGHIHIAIGLCLHRYNNLDYTPLFDERHLLYCGKKNPLFDTSPKKLNAEDISQASYVSWGDGDKLFENDWSFNEVAYSAHPEGVAYFVLSGQFIGFMPDHYAQQWVDKGLIKPLLEDTYQRIANYYLIARNNDQQQEIVEAFIQALRSKFSSYLDS